MFDFTRYQLMAYLLISVAVVLFLVVFSIKTRRNHRLDEIRMEWSSVKPRETNFHRARRYARQFQNPGPHNLSQQTVDDIDSSKLFSFVDRTTSAPGQRYSIVDVSVPPEGTEFVVTTADPAI